MTRGHIEDKIKWLESVGIKFPQDEQPDYPPLPAPNVYRIGVGDPNAFSKYQMMEYGDACVKAALEKELK